jgi:cobyrinic acid a,c-diamide synthase
MDIEKRVKGIILNRISPMFYSTIQPIIERECCVPVVGFFPKQENGTLESRYLGLKLPGEMEDIQHKIMVAAETIEKTVDIARLLEISSWTTVGRSESVGETGVLQSSKATTVRVRVAIAVDEAFCFYYEDNLRMLREAGAELIPFSPLHDKQLPGDIAGIILGGGYPENYAEQLSINVSMREDIKKAIADGIPSLAECGGFMYLHEDIQTREGLEYPWVGSVQGKCRYTGHLVRFGYVTLEEKNSRFLPCEYNTIRAHEFHYFDSDNNGSDCICVKPFTGKKWDSSHVDVNHFWGYAHLYYPSNPQFPLQFVKQCIDYAGIKRGQN